VFFTVQHGGGGSLARIVELFLEQHDTAPPGALVLVDSDRTHPDARMGGTAQAAVDACARCTCRATGEPRYHEGWSLDPFILEKREVENYIPIKAVEKFAGKVKSDAVRALRNLGSDQRSFYDMKSGLRSALLRDENGAASDDPSSWTWTDPGQEELFNQDRVDIRDLMALRDGFGSAIWKAFNDEKHVHAASLREQGGEELERLVRRVLALV
jgi:hypothetical protein